MPRHTTENLFAETESSVEPTTDVAAPLAERMRPRAFDEFVGQRQLVGEGRFLRRVIEGEGSLPSLILWGAPGTGKTTLARIIAKHGRGICDTPKRVEALLRDLCGAYRREINIVMGALEERVAADLMTAGKSAVPRAAILARLAARLRDNLAYTPEAAPLMKLLRELATRPAARDLVVERPGLRLALHSGPALS